jgi:[ribosomal protein S5]-alanine N-acetyltransferase
MLSAPPRPDIPTLAALPAVIETSRLVLRPLTLADVDDLRPYVTDPELSKYLSWSAHKDRAETEAWITAAVERRTNGTGMVWSIVIDGKACGVIGLDGIKWEFRAWRIDRAELGYWLGIPHWSKGYMTEAAFAATKWAFDALGLHKVTIGCIEGNVASQKIIERIGYRFLAKLEDDVWRDNRWWPHRRYEMLASEWGDTTSTQRFVRRA